MKALWMSRLMVPVLFLAPFARAQHVAISGGGIFLPYLSSPPSAGTVGGLERADFSDSPMLAVDAGVYFFSFLGAGLHYSYSRPELRLFRGDAFGSSARVGLGVHTVAFEALLRSRPKHGVRAFVFCGAGFSSFLLDVKEQVEVPFARMKPPGREVTPVFTFGGGLEKRVAPWISGKIEIRDYVGSVPASFYRPGGSWHRPSVVAGIVLGR
jgi:hypothetical protein